MVPGNLRQKSRRQRRKMSTNTTITTIDASAEDIRRVQEIEDDNGCGSISTSRLLDWQRKRSIDFPCFQVANSNNVSYLSSGCLVLILFSSDSFFRLLHEILSVLQSCGKYFCTKCTLTLRMYPLRTGE